MIIFLKVVLTLILDFSLGNILIGDGTILNEPYERYYDYKTGPFPSGNIQKTNFISFDIKWLYKPNICLTFSYSSNSLFNIENVYLVDLSYRIFN